MKKLILCLSALFLWTSLSIAEPKPETHTYVVQKLLKGIEDNDLEVYHSVCDAEMQEAVRSEDLDELNALLGEAMEMGYKPEYLGALDKNGKTLHLWRLNFTVKGIPDMLAELMLKDKKASSFTVK